MFKKNNIICILIFALGFFWCSSLYLTQESALLNISNTNYVNYTTLLFGNLSMAVGILLFCYLYKKNTNMRMFYVISIALAVISSISFFATDNKFIMAVCLCLSSLYGAAGFGAGYHFSLVAQNVQTEYRGRVFAFGYVIGTILTFLMTLLPTRMYSSIESLAIYLPVIIITLILTLKKNDLCKIDKEKTTPVFRNYLIIISIIVVAMSLLTQLTTDTINMQITSVSKWFTDSRIYFCIGMIIAGFLADKKNKLFEIITISSLACTLIAIILLKDGYSASIISAFTYVFIAFFVLFRTVIFTNVMDVRKNMIWLAPFGLMFSKLMESLMVLFERKLISHYTLLIIVMAIVLALIIVIYFAQYFKNIKDSENDTIKSISNNFKLSSQEEKVLSLLLLDKTNQEIADDLFLSINTIRNHVAAVYRKTGMKKQELKDKFNSRTN